MSHQRTAILSRHYCFFGTTRQASGVRYLGRRGLRTTPNLSSRGRLPVYLGSRCGRQCVAAVAAEAEVAETALQSPSGLQSLRVQFQSGEISTAGCRPLLQDVNAEVFLCRSNDEALILGVDSSSGASSMHDMALGKLNCKRFLACARCKLWWMTPEWGSTAEEMPPETQFLLLELAEGGPYAVVLPLIDNNTFRATLRPFKFSEPATPSSDAEQRLYLRLESGDPSVLGQRWSNALYVAAGWEPFELVDKAVAEAAALSGNSKPRTEKALPPSLDVFGWCTWDAFYSTVSARGLQIGLQSLVSGGIPPKLLIIDDGWQSTDVDAELRQPMSKKLHLSEPMPELDDTMAEFVEAELEMLSMATRDVPAGSTLGVALEALSADEENLTHHNRSKSNPDMPWRKSKSERRRKKAKESGQIDYDSDDSSAWSQEDQKQREAELIEAAASEEPSARASTEASTSGRDDTRLPQADASALKRADEGTLTQSDKERLIHAAGLGVPQQPPQQMGLMWLLSAVAQRFVGLFVGLLNAGLVRIYQYVVDPAPPDSWPNKLFTLLAAGPLRMTILEFLAASGDFTRRLTDVKANSKFSSPLAGPRDYFSGNPPRLDLVVQSLKERFGLDYIYCWHGLPAYWSGVATPEDAPAMTKYGARLIYAKPTRGLYEIEPSAAWNPAVIGGVGVPMDVEELYNDMHRYLADAGISGVKVDCQAGVGLAGSAMGGGASLAAKYHEALEDSVAAHFRDNHVINCMCHSTENLYRMRDTAVVRASDDFYPRNEASSHPHVAACAFNSVFLGALAQPDWDMFHSKHPAAELHAAARALSGGAVYVSDYPGKHSFEILRKLVLPDGSTLRALNPGRPTRDSLFKDVLRDDESLLKVWNVNRYSGMVGIFHLQGSSWDRRKRQFVTHDQDPRPLQTEVRPRDVDAFARQLQGAARPWHLDEELPSVWASYSEATDEVVCLRADESVRISLRCGHSAVVTFAPVLEIEGVRFAALGLTEMLNSGGAVLSCRLDKGVAASSRAGNGHSRKAARTITGEVEARGCGKFELYASGQPEQCLLNGEPLDFQYSQAAGRLTVQLPQAKRMQWSLQVVFHV